MRYSRPQSQIAGWPLRGRPHAPMPFPGFVSDATHIALSSRVITVEQVWPAPTPRRRPLKHAMCAFGSPIRSGSRDVSVSRHYDWPLERNLGRYYILSTLLSLLLRNTYKKLTGTTTRNILYFRGEAEDLASIILEDNGGYNGNSIVDISDRDASGAAEGVAYDTVRRISDLSRNVGRI